jgi:hypothetical protein
MVKVGVKLVPPVGVSLRLPQRHGASAAHLARCHHLPLNAVGGLLVVFHGSALPVLRFAGGSLARDLCEIRLRQLQHRPRTDCHAGRPDTRCHATELERIETNQTRLIEERAQLQDELQEARAEVEAFPVAQTCQAAITTLLQTNTRVCAGSAGAGPCLWRRLDRAAARAVSVLALLQPFRPFDQVGKSAQAGEQTKGDRTVFQAEGAQLTEKGFQHLFDTAG